MTAFPMPMRNERTAPSFDPSYPQGLPRFFEDLEELMARADIKTDKDKKRHVVKYVDVKTEQIWKTFPEYEVATYTYDQFKEVLLEQYPDATGDFVYSIRDMDLLIGERQRIGITTMQDLSDYHLQFMAITRWLISKKHLADLEQQRAYVRSFQPHLLSQVMNRLAITKSDHHPNVPYPIKDVHEAARFILQGVVIPAAPQAPATPSSSNNFPTSNEYVKAETLATVMAQFTKTMNEALSYNRSRSSFTKNDQDAYDCNYCGEKHRIKDCHHVEEDIKAGKCKKNHENKVVLPNGNYVSRSVPGKWMRDRIFEWLRQNPSAQTVPTLVHTVESRLIGPPETGAPPTNAVASYQLSTDDRIAVLKAELYNLETRKQAAPVGVRTRAQKARGPSIEEVEDEDSPPARKKFSASKEDVEEISSPQTQKQPIILPPARTAEHPFRYAKDASYAPPSTKNVGTQDKAPAVPKRSEPAYKTLPPIHDPAIATSVFQRSMEAPITITQRELLSLSPEVRSQVRETTTTRRIPAKDNIASQNLYEEEEEEADCCQPTTVNTYALVDAYNMLIPEGALVVEDEIEAYYNSLDNEEDLDLDRLIVSEDNCAIRAINLLVGNSHRIECILDSGCQIIAMSQAVCHALGLMYDPSIILHMQSANGTLNPSLGLARNVPFQLDTITIYLQVHVISSPAYDILLGRPFDILTRSVVRNFANEDQTITIQDPNSGRRVTIPTMPRSKKEPKCSHPNHEQNVRRARQQRGFQ